MECSLATETTAWKKLKEAFLIAGAWAERIDVPRSRGVPDVWWCAGPREAGIGRGGTILGGRVSPFPPPARSASSGWLELKALRRPGERVKMRPEQVAWLRTRAAKGAKVGVAVMMADASWRLYTPSPDVDAEGRLFQSANQLVEFVLGG